MGWFPIRTQSQYLIEPHEWRSVVQRAKSFDIRLWDGNLLSDVVVNKKDRQWQ